MDKSVTVKFWQIGETDEAEPFFRSLDACLSKPDMSRIKTINDVTLQLQPQPRGRNSNDPYVADVIRLQNSGLPSVLERGGKAERFQLEAGKYLGHHSAFIYDDEYRLFGLEIRPSAAGLGRTLELIKAISRFDGYFPTPAVKKSALDELASAKNGTFTFKIADPASLEATDPELVSIRDNLRELKGMIDGTYLKVSVGVGRRRRGLDASGILKLAGWLSGEKEADRGKIRSVKVDQPDQDFLLDFIKGQVQSRETLAFTDDPETDWQLRSDLLISSLQKAKRHVRSFPKRT